MITTEIFQAILQQGIAIAVLVWIVTLGDKKMERMYSDYATRTEWIIKHLVEDNTRLSDTLITCISAVSNDKPCSDD